MRLRFLVRLSQSIILCLAVSAAAFAQYGGGSSGSSPTTYTPPKSGYSTGKAVGIGVGVAAAVAAIALYVHHRHNASRAQASLVGCTETGQNGLSLRDETDSKTYSLVNSSKDVKPGERVELKGKKAKDGSGNPSFVVQNLVGDYGVCRAQKL